MGGSRKQKVAVGKAGLSSILSFIISVAVYGVILCDEKIKIIRLNFLVGFHAKCNSGCKKRSHALEGEDNPSNVRRG